jgi:hypothetical protein
MKVKITYTKHITKEIEADNFQDAAYIATLKMPEGYYISSLEEVRQPEESELFHLFGEIFKPKN